MRAPNPRPRSARPSLRSAAAWREDHRRGHDMRASTASAPNDATPALDYQPGHPVRRRRRRTRFLGALVVAAFVALCAWQGPGAYRRAVRAYWARQVAHYRAPADLVVYEEDPAQWPSLLARGGYRSMPSNAPGWCPFVAYMNEP